MGPARGDECGAKHHPNHGLDAHPQTVGDDRFIVLTLVLGLAKLQHAMELLPIIGTLASTRALFRCKGLTVRCVMWCATACWVVHNFWLGSIGGTMIEGSFLVMNGLNIIRFRRMQKRG